MNKWTTLLLTFWVVSWTSHEVKGRPCTAKEKAETWTACTDEVPVSNEKRFDVKADAAMFLAKFPSTEDSNEILEEVTE